MKRKRKKNTKESQAIVDLLITAINDRKVTKITIKEDGQEQMKTVEIEPLLILRDPEDSSMTLKCRDCQTRFLAVFFLRNILHAETLESIFTNDREIHTPLNGKEVICASEDVIIDEVDPNEECYRHPCIFCGDDEDCEHIFYLWDYFGHEISHGRIDEILEMSSIVEEVFLKLFMNKIKISRNQLKEISPELRSLWEYSDLEDDNKVYLPQNSFIDFVEELISRSGFQAVALNYATGGGVGNDVVLQICYATDQDRLLSYLREKIKSEMKFFEETLRERGLLP